MVGKSWWGARPLARAVVLVLAVALAAGGRARAAEGGGAGAIKVAVAGPISGQFAVFGEQMRLGAEAAVADINAKGGVLGRRLDLLVADDLCDPVRAVEVARRLADQGAKLVVRHFCSSTSIPAASVYQERGVVMVTPASSNPLLTESGHTLVFRVVGRDDRQGRFAAAYVLDQLPGRRVAVLDDDSQYGTGIAQAFAARLRRGGVAPVARLRLVQGEPAYPGIVDALRRARAELVFFGGYHSEAAAVLRGAKAAGLKLRLIGPDSLAAQEFWEQVGDAGEGTLVDTGGEFGGATRRPRARG